MSVRPVLGIFLGMLLTVGVGCASPAEEDTANDDSALRAVQKGDFVMPVLDATPALNVPAKFSSIVTWSVDYVEMKDPVPDNNYKGLMIYGRDASGDTVYMVPVGYSGSDAIATQGSASMFVYSADTDAAGNLLPVTFGLGEKASPERLASEKVAIDWIVSEQKRLLTTIAAAGDTDQASTQSLHLQTNGWLTGAFCAAHIASLLALGNPLLYFVLDGGLNILEGGADKMAGGVTDGSGGQIGKGVVEIAGSKAAGAVIKRVSAATATKLAKGGGAVGAALIVGQLGYNVYKQGAVKGTVNTLLSLVPESCIKTVEALMSK